MKYLSLRRPSPALVVSLAALFFALGGSAFAVGERLTAAQPRCANGAVKGFAHVTGGSRGMGSLPGAFSGSAELFRTRFNCSGKAVQVRLGAGPQPGVDVRFVGIDAKLAVASPVGSSAGGATVTPMPDGSFRVTTGGDREGTFVHRGEFEFVIVVF